MDELTLYEQILDLSAAKFASDMVPAGEAYATG